MISFRHHPLIGTFVDLTIVDDVDDHTAEAIDDTMVHEMERLESMCSIFNPKSELSRWRRGETRTTSTELTALLTLGLEWQLRTGGVFNTASRLLTDRWRRAEAEQRVPSAGELADLAATIVEPRYVIDDRHASAIGDVSAIDLNALAKGWIVDRATELITERHPNVAFIVDAGGDLRHRGTTAIAVGIENPLRPYDNEPPIARYELAGQALATSGGARRGFVIDGRHYPHLIDPSTGQPTERHASVSIIATDAATADVLATATSLLEPPAALDLAQLVGVGCLVISPEGSLIWNDLGRPLT